MKRIAVVGPSCSGKTTLTQKISASLGYPHIELDALFWGENWTRRQAFYTDVKLKLENEAWVMDGNYGMVRDIIWQRATTVIILDLPFHIVFFRALTRTIKRIVTREKLFNGNIETFKAGFFSLDGIPLWVIRTYWKRRRHNQALKKNRAFSHIRFVTLSSRAAVNQFIHRLQGDIP